MLHLLSLVATKVCTCVHDGYQSDVVLCIVWVARNMQVYLCIDCTASLVAQKVMLLFVISLLILISVCLLQKYAFLPQVPPRTEDIIVLSQLYEMILRPFIVRELNWVR